MIEKNQLLEKVTSQEPEQNKKIVLGYISAIKDILNKVKEKNSSTPEDDLLVKRARNFVEDLEANSQLKDLLKEQTKDLRVLFKEYVEQTQKVLSESSRKYRSITSGVGSYPKAFYNEVGEKTKTARSLENILSGENFEEIAQKFLSARGADGLFQNYEELKAYIKEKGYSPDYWFGDVELDLVGNYIISQYQLQLSIPEKQDKDLLAILLDFNNDGVLSSDRKYYSTESQMFYAIVNSITSGGIKTFFQEIGLGDVETFKQKMSKNLSSAKKEFETKLSMAYERGMKLGMLTKEGGSQKSAELEYNRKVELSTKTKQELENNEVLKQKLTPLGEEVKKDLLNRLHFEAFNIALGYVRGASVGFNIKEFVNGFVDSLSFGMFNGAPGIAFTKELFEKKGFKLSGSLVNFFIPILTASYTQEVDSKVKSLFPEEFKGKYALSASASVSTFGKVYTASLNRVDDQTKAGIETMLKELSTSLDVVKKDILDGKTFEESEYKKISKDKNDQKVYDDLKQYFDGLKKYPYAQSALNDVINSYFAHVRNTLYSNSDGFKFTSIGLGVSLGAINSIFAFVGAEYHNQTYKSMIHRVKEERAISLSNKIDLSKLGINLKDKYNGFDVMSISKDAHLYDFSAPNGQIQAEMIDGKLYFSGKDIKTIEIEEYLSGEEVQRIIVINGGEKDSKTQLYKKSQTTNITEGISLQLTPIVKTSKDLMSENISQTKEIRSNIFNIIGDDGFKVSGMYRLQEMIFSLSRANVSQKKDKYEIMQVWTQFVNLVNSNEFANYASKKGATQTLTALKNSITSSSLTIEQKFLILQTIPSCLMKKSRLKIQQDKVKIGTALSKYDEKRHNFFDGIFAKEVPELSDSIKKARKEWFAKNGNSKEYIFSPQTGGIAFSATQSIKPDGKTNVNGLLPFVGAYNVVDAGTPFIDIDKKSPQLVEKLPKSYLEMFSKILKEKFNIDLKNLSEVINFINKGGDSTKGVKIDYNLAFCKMGECVNDAIVFKDIVITSNGQELSIPATTTSEGGFVDNDVYQIGAAYVKEVDRRKEEPPKEEKPSEKPSDSPSVQPSVQPSIQPSVQPSIQPPVQPSVQPPTTTEGGSSNTWTGTGAYNSDAGKLTNNGGNGQVGGGTNIIDTTTNNNTVITGSDMSQNL